MSNVAVQDVKEWAGVTVSVPDALVQTCIDAVESVINADTGRTIAVTATNASARVYQGKGDAVLPVHDFASTSGLVVVNNGTTVSSSNYQLEPLNGVTVAGMAVPYDAIRLIDGTTWYADPWGAARITITAKWGWGASLPSAYTPAVCIAVHDLLSNRDVRNGVILADIAVRIRKNPAVAALIEQLTHARRWGVA